MNVKQFFDCGKDLLMSREMELEGLAIRMGNLKECTRVVANTDYSKDDLIRMQQLLLDEAVRCVDELQNITFNDFKAKEVEK
jgi:hypothetical protein